MKICSLLILIHRILDKLYNFTFSAEVLGPSFFVKVAKKHVIGFTIC